MRGSVRAGGRSRAAALAAATALALTVSACSDDGSAEADPSGSTAPAGSSSSEPSDDASSEAPEELPEVDPEFGFTAGGVCRGEATLAGTQPFPDDPSELAVEVLFESMPFPDLETDEPYVPVGTAFDWSAPLDQDYSAVNAIACVSVVPGSTEVVLECTAELPELQPDAWEVWRGDYVVSIVDPTTAEVVAEGEPFSSGDFLPSGPQCQTSVPLSDPDAAYGYVSDMPTIRYWGAELEEVVQQLS